MTEPKAIAQLIEDSVELSKEKQKFVSDWMVEAEKQGRKVTYESISDMFFVMKIMQLQKRIEFLEQAIINKQ